MHSFWSRANAIFAFALSTLSALTFLCFLSNCTKDFSTMVKISSKGQQVKHLPDYTADREKNDLGYLNFDLQADMSPLFDWNTKQLFLYLTAEYATKNNIRNEVVLWDKIIQRGDNPVVDLKAANPKYYFWDDGAELKGHKNVTLTLSWDVIPNAGRLQLFDGRGSHRLEFPAEYVTGKLGK